MGGGGAVESYCRTCIELYFLVESTLVASVCVVSCMCVYYSYRVDMCLCSDARSEHLSIYMPWSPQHDDR